MPESQNRSRSGSKPQRNRRERIPRGPKAQKNSRFRARFSKLEKAVAVSGLFGGSPGKLRENPGKIAGKIFPNREMLQILGFQAPGKANLPGTLGPHCRDLVPTFHAGCLLKPTVQPSRVFLRD